MLSSLVGAHDSQQGQPKDAWYAGSCNRLRCWCLHESVPAPPSPLAWYSAARLDAAVPKSQAATPMKKERSQAQLLAPLPICLRRS